MQDIATDVWPYSSTGSTEHLTTWGTRDLWCNENDITKLGPTIGRLSFVMSVSWHHRSPIDRQVLALGSHRSAAMEDTDIERSRTGLAVTTLVSNTSLSFYIKWYKVLFLKDNTPEICFIALSFVMWKVCWYSNYTKWSSYFVTYLALNSHFFNKMVTFWC